MFTGIVEDVGKVEYIRGNEISVLTKIKDITTGDSLLVDGVCLTVTKVYPDSGHRGGVNNQRVMMDMGAETKKITTLKGLYPGYDVNLESSLTLSDKIGGHFVYGHIMATGRVISNKLFKNVRVISIKSGRDFLNKLIYKGSVAVNGVSLTVADLNKNFFKVAVVPETIKRTNLGRLRCSDIVNLEADMLVVKGKG